jgi:hypothetical protein
VLAVWDSAPRHNNGGIGVLFYLYYYIFIIKEEFIAQIAANVYVKFVEGNLKISQRRHVHIC